MLSRPVINLITVVRNAERTIGATLGSVLEQDYPGLRYLVIDGASNDGTTGIIEAYRPRLTHYINEPDKGIYHAMNKGICAAEGDLALFLNAGDTLIAPDVLSRFVREHYREGGQTIWLCRVQTTDGLLIEPVRVRFRSRYKLPVYHQGIIFPLAALKVMSFALEYRLVADFHQYYRLSQLVPSRPVPLLLARFDTSGVSSTYTERLNREFIAAYRELGIGWPFIWYRRLRILLRR